MILRVRVTPNAKKARIEEDGDVLRVWVDAPAVNGKANKRLVEILAKHLGVKKGDVKIVRGEKGRDKLIEVPDDATKSQ